MAEETDAADSEHGPPRIPLGAVPEFSPARALKEPNPLLRLLKVFGPGLVTGASDDDPSGIGTYAVAGASLGFSTLWTALASFPLMAAVQFICAKIGMVTGLGLAGVLRRHYSVWLLYPAIIGLVVANTINAGADIGAIAQAIAMLAHVNGVTLVVPIALLLLAFQIFGSYRLIERTFKWLALTLLAYIGAAFFARPNVLEVLRGTFVPTLRVDGRFLSTLVALLGTTISPYLFFWQSDQEAEEERSMGRAPLFERQGAAPEELRAAAIDVNIGMALSNLVMYFIILATAATLFKAGKTHIQSATDAAQALRPLAGDGAYWLLALGLIGSGFLAVPILTSSAAYAVAEALGWYYGLDRRPGRARGFYAVIAASTLVGMLVNYLGINPIDALFWTAIINGMLAPPLLVIIMVVSNNRAIMGPWVNGWLTNLLGWGATVVMFGAAIGLIVTWGH